MFFISITLTGWSQFYFRLGGGGGIGFPYNDSTFSNSVGHVYYTWVDPADPVKERVNSSYGTGLNGSVAFGWMINKYIGVELVFNEFYARSVKTIDSVYGEWPRNTWFCYEETTWG